MASKNRRQQVYHTFGAATNFLVRMRANPGTSSPATIYWGDANNSKTDVLPMNTGAGTDYVFTYPAGDQSTAIEKVVVIDFQSPENLDLFELGRSQRVSRFDGTPFLVAGLTTFDIGRMGGTCFSLPVFKAGLQALIVDQNALTAVEVFNSTINCKTSLLILKVGSGDPSSTLRNNGQAVSGRQNYNLSEYPNLEILYINSSMADLSGLASTKLKDLRFWSNALTAVPTLPTTIEQVWCGAASGDLGNQLTTAFDPTPYLANLYYSNFNACFYTSAASRAAGYQTLRNYALVAGQFLTAAQKVLNIAGRGSAGLQISASSTDPVQVQARADIATLQAAGFNVIYQAIA
ncbi:hypothetical protein GCM10023183_08530 [Nibribacter koreensis]|uniref:Uncharacterized protein n=1 Tax=Nibribacter koreensis TaxID=1084519 RepID=A0ABP8FB96_9BACT